MVNGDARGADGRTSDLIERSGDCTRLAWEPVPTSVTYELTRVCDLRCRFCYQGDQPAAVHPPLEHATRVLDAIAAGGVSRVVFVGGEPFSYPAWPQVLAHAAGLGLTCAFVTNGQTVGREAAAQAADSCAHGLVSIHGDEAVHDALTGAADSFSRAAAGARRLAEAGLAVGLYYTLIEENHTRVHDAVSAVLRSGAAVRWIAVNRGVHQGSGLTGVGDALDGDAYRRVLEQLVRIRDELGVAAFLEVGVPLCLIPARYHDLVFPCRIGAESVAVDHRGVVRLCPVMPGHVIGDLLERPLDEMWRDAPVLRARRALGWLPERCRDCELLGRCLAGCLAAGDHGAPEA